MAIAGENSTQTSARGYPPYTVHGNLEYPIPSIQVVIQSHIHIIKNRTYVTLVGIPAKADLFGIHPLMSYLDEEGGMVNLRSVVEILHAVKVEIKG